MTVSSSLHPLYILVFPSIRNEQALAVPLLFSSCHRPSRIIRPSGITNDIEGAPKAPFLRIIACLSLVCCSISFSSLIAPSSSRFPASVQLWCNLSLSIPLCALGLSPAGYWDNPAERRFNWIIRTARQKPANGS